VRRYSAEQEKRLSGLTPEAMKVLQAYDYPGNVRELENIVEHAVTLAAGPRIDIGDLPKLRQSVATGAADAAQAVLPDEGFDLDRVLADYERVIVLKALEQTGGVRKRAARLLGITFRSLRYRLAKMGIDDSAAEE
jgi:two-component system response regulator PilR (NtrC family)